MPAVLPSAASGRKQRVEKPRKFVGKPEEAASGDAAVVLPASDLPQEIRVGETAFQTAEQLFGQDGFRLQFPEGIGFRREKAVRVVAGFEPGETPPASVPSQSSC